MIYLVKSEARNGTFFKVGFTSNLDNRMKCYSTHNPNIKLVETVVTYKKTKHNLETEVHNEIAKMGYTFHIVEINDILTEWFFVPIEKEKEFEEKGLAQFSACKNRVICKVCKNQVINKAE